MKGLIKNAFLRFGQRGVHRKHMVNRPVGQPRKKMDLLLINDSFKKMGFGVWKRGEEFVRGMDDSCLGEGILCA